MIRRDRDAWHHALMTLLPRGAVWPREAGSVLSRTMRALVGIVERWADDAATFLLIEAFPPSSALLLTDWERVLGLPEPCFPVAQTIAERRAAVREKLQRRPGAQSLAYFIEIARRLGYHVVDPGYAGLALELPADVSRHPQVSIREYRPFMCGVSRCGDRTWGVMHQRQRFYWTVRISDPRLTWFRAGRGGGRAGTDPMVRIRRADDLECVINRLKPAHTLALFDYRGI